MTKASKTESTPKGKPFDLFPLKKNHPFNEKILHDILNGFSPSLFIMLLTVEGTVTYMNKSALAAIDTTLNDVLGKPLVETLWGAFSGSTPRNFQNAIKLAAKGKSSRFDLVFTDKSGKRWILDFLINPILASDAQVAYLIASAQDVTEHEQTQHSLHLTQFAIDNAGEAIFQIGANGRIIYVNDSVCRQLGFSSDKLIGSPIYQFDKQLNEAKWQIRWNEIKKHGSLRNESVYRHASGREIPVELSSTYFEYNEEEVIFVYFSDISEHKSSAARIDYFAHYDRMTRLPNRILLTSRLNHAISLASSRNTGVTVLIIGLDRFKLVNDILGNSGGDEILKIAADRMVKCVREMDTVARIGGDEFAIVLEHISTRVEEMSQTAQRILDIFLQPFNVNGQELLVMCSIGVAVYPKNGKDADELLKNANAALHLAKAQGGNNYCFYTSAPGSRDPERWQLEVDLRNALANNEMKLHYQPRIDVHSGKILGAEALLRWQHPRRGMILPEQFITIAEETGLIFSIGEWVVSAACQQGKQWSDEGLKLGRIGVNLSARQFRQKALVSTVARILEESGIEPKLLELELTESLLMHDVSSAIQTMYELKELGVHIALDDFGTGYSSLSYLRYFPIDTLKIDRSFVSEITFDENSVAIAEAIIVMAHRLKLTVIAEGVETQEQLTILKERGCDQIQGFHFSRPLTATELTGLLQKKIIF